jgi:hypothetical protein
MRSQKSQRGNTGIGNQEAYSSQVVVESTRVAAAFKAPVAAKQAMRCALLDEACQAPTCPAIDLLSEASMTLHAIAEMLWDVPWMVQLSEGPVGGSESQN